MASSEALHATPSSAVRFMATTSFKGNCKRIESISRKKLSSHYLLLKQ